ncbi:hypothetical protein C6A37_06680 [Desulfobacteraceae bacterium SEEP-SAG9]|nr:hypothetical protein C6A37_06680 [Desulfobacteraceae bacterium SEEP-SAG9]
MAAVKSNRYIFRQFRDALLFDGCFDDLFSFSRRLQGRCGILPHSPLQQPAQHIRSGNDPLLVSPEQDNIFIDDIVFSVLRVNLESYDGLAQARLWLPDDNAGYGGRW